MSVEIKSEGIRAGTRVHPPNLPNAGIFSEKPIRGASQDVITWHCKPNQTLMKL